MNEQNPEEQLVVSVDQETSDLRNGWTARYQPNPFTDGAVQAAVDYAMTAIESPTIAASRAEQLRAIYDVARPEWIDAMAAGDRAWRSEQIHSPFRPETVVAGGGGGGTSAVTFVAPEQDNSLHRQMFEQHRREQLERAGRSRDTIPNPATPRGSIDPSRYNLILKMDPTQRTNDFGEEQYGIEIQVKHMRPELFGYGVLYDQDGVLIQSTLDSVPELSGTNLWLPWRPERMGEPLVDAWNDEDERDSVFEMIKDSVREINDRDFISDSEPTDEPGYGEDTNEEDDEQDTF